MTELKPDKIVDLFNSKLAGKGKIKPCPGFFLPATIVQDFITMRSYPKFDQIETWEEYFSMVEKSSFLTNVFTPSLAWLLKPENAFKVFSGQYDDKDMPDNSKTAKNANNEAQAMASDLFNKIIQAGQHGLMKQLQELNPVEQRAIELFGRASEILQCNERQVTDIKIRLRNAFIKALE